MEHISKTIKKLLENSGLEKGVAQYSVIEKWPEIVGKKISENAFPESIDHGVLLLRAKSPAWTQELHFQKKNIINTINKKTKKKIVKDIRFI